MSKHIIPMTLEEINSGIGMNLELPDEISADFNLLYGGFIEWNQLASLDPDDWGTERTAVSSEGNTIVGTVTASISNIKYIYMPLTKNHKYIVLGKLTNGSVGANLFYGIWTGTTGNVYQVRAFVSRAVSVPTVQDIALMYSVTVDDPYFRLQEATAAITGETFSAENLQIFDITQMFGSEKANEIYAMEQAQADAGIAWFKNLFPDDYYEYNAGELMPVGDEAKIVMVITDQQKIAMVIDDEQEIQMAVHLSYGYDPTAVAGFAIAGIAIAGHN